mgnify:CR=1 FL=1
MKPPTFLSNLTTTVCYNYLLCTHTFLLYGGIKPHHYHFAYYWIGSQSSSLFYGTKKKKFLVGLNQIYHQDEAQYWLHQALEKLLKIISLNPLKGAPPYCVKSEEVIGKIVIGLPNPSPPSYVFIDCKSPLLLINKFIDYNDRVDSTPLTISSKATNEIKTTHQGEIQACWVDKYQALKMSLLLLKSVRVLSILLSTKMAVTKLALTTNFFLKLKSCFTMNQIICPAKQNSFPPAQNGQPNCLFLQCPGLVQVASLPKKPARWDLTSTFLIPCYSATYTHLVFSSVTSTL